MARPVNSHRRRARAADSSRANPNSHQPGRHCRRRNSIRSRPAAEPAAAAVSGWDGVKSLNFGRSLVNYYAALPKDRLG